MTYRRQNPSHVSSRPTKWLAALAGVVTVLLSMIVAPQASATPPPPVAVTAVSPTTVSTAGGTTVTITGSGFVSNGVSGVSIGDRGALSFTVVDDWTITAQAAPGATGPATIYLYQPFGDGLQEDAFPGLLSYACLPSSDPLTITAIYPSSGSWNDPGGIEIDGTGFDCAPTVTVGGRPVRMDFLVGNSEFYGTVPAVGMNDIGPVDVTMSRTLPTSDSVTVVDGYAYDPPSISYPWVRVVSSLGGPFRVYGGGFTSQSSLLIGGVPMTLSQPPSSFLLTTLPALTPGPAALTVVTPGLPDAIWGGSFNVAAPTAVSCSSDNSMEISVQPNAGLLFMAGAGGCNLQQFLERGSEGGDFDAPSLQSYGGALVSSVSDPIGIYNAGLGLGYTAGPNNGVDVVKLSANGNPGAPSVTITITVGTGRPPSPQPPAPAPTADPTPTATPTPAPSATPSSTSTSSAPLIQQPVVPPVVIPASQQPVAGGSTTVIGGKVATCTTVTTNAGTTTACGTPPAKLYCNAGPAYQVAPRVGVTPPNGGGLAPGLYVQVLDGMIHLSNTGGSQNFSAGQFGFTPSYAQPPVVLPANPGLQFAPPPAFSPTSSAPSGSSPSAVDCQVRSRSGVIQATGQAVKKGGGADVAVGDALQFRMGGLAPRSPVSMYLNDGTVPLGTLKADAKGDVAGWVRVPAGTPVGTNHLQLSAVMDGDQSVAVITGFTVHAPKPVVVTARSWLSALGTKLPPTATKALTTLSKQVPATVPSRCAIAGNYNGDARSFVVSQLGQIKSRLAGYGLRCSTTLTPGNANRAVITVHTTR